MKVILYIVVIYLVVRYLLRPILMAFVVKSAGKMMNDMQNRGTVSKEQKEKQKKAPKEVPGEYIDYEEVK